MHRCISQRSSLWRIQYERNRFESRKPRLFAIVPARQVCQRKNHKIPINFLKWKNPTKITAGRCRICKSANTIVLPVGGRLIHCTNCDIYYNLEFPSKDKLLNYYSEVYKISSKQINDIEKM